MIDERMFRHIKSGVYLRKESILALLIAMGQNLVNIQIALKKAGFILSASMYSDTVVIWMMENKLIRNIGTARLASINNVLYDLDLPLLMTRSKE